MVRCFRCPIAYHSGDGCIAAGSLFVSSHILICSNHSKRNHSSSAVNVGFCFVCARGEHTCFLPPPPPLFYSSVVTLGSLVIKRMCFLKPPSHRMLWGSNAAWDCLFVALVSLHLLIFAGQKQWKLLRSLLVLPVGKSGWEAPSSSRCMLRMDAVWLLTVCWAKGGPFTNPKLNPV